MRRVAYKFRMYPTGYQRSLISRTFGCTRFIWNQMLAEAKESYETTKKFSYRTPAKFKPEFPFLKEVDSLALCNAQMNLKSSFSRFFSDRKKKSGRKAGFPRFKSKKSSRKSYTTNCINGNIGVSEGKLKLPKLGSVKVIFHQRVLGKIKSATVSQDPSGKYYVSILTEQPDLHKREINPTNVVGLDMSFSDFYVTHEGSRPKYPRWFRQSEKKLARAQRRLSRKQKGSASYEKQKIRVARIHEKIRNKRLDFVRKEVVRLTEKYDVFVVEDIALKSMSSRGNRRRFGKSVLDLGFGMFRSMLDQKAELLGGLFVKADRFFPSSQLCSCCGFRNRETKDLSLREWTCPDCRSHHDRDQNAAKNLVNFYLSTVASTESYADGDSTSTPDLRRWSKWDRGTRKSCGTVDSASPLL